MHVPMSFIQETELPDLLHPDGRFKLQTNRYFETVSSESLRYWCLVSARYGVPNVELVLWLRLQIGNKKAIEIGAGHGDLCGNLGIVGTDNYSQEFPDVSDYYRRVGQPTIRYGSTIERIDAVSAVKKYKPAVVIASWVTQWVDPDKPIPPDGGSMYGVNEEEILQSGARYILIGNATIHGRKRIMAFPHEEMSFPFLHSRSASPQSDRVWIWNGR